MKVFFHKMKSLRWGTPYNGLYGEATPEGVPFSRFRCKKGGGADFTELTYTERVGKSVISVCVQKGPKGLWDAFYGCANRAKRN